MKFGLRKKQKGMTLIETMIGTTILITVISGALATINYLWRAVRFQKTYSTELAIAYHVMNNARANTRMHYTFPYEVGATSAAGNLIQPKGAVTDMYDFSDKFFGLRGTCETCPGRMSFWMQPHPMLPGLVEIVVRIRYPETGRTRTYSSFAGQ